MARNNQDWEELGRSIQEIVDRAVNSRDFQKMNQTINQVVGKAVDAGSEAVRKAMDPPTQEKELAPLYGKTSRKTAGGIAKIAGGVVLSCVSFVSLAGCLIYDAFFGHGLLSGPVLGSAVFLGLGVWTAARGVQTLGQLSRFKTYRRVLGEKTHCALDKLAHSVGKSVKFVKKELLKMIDQGLFLQGHLDKEEKSFITSDETYRLFEQSRLQLEERRRQEAQEKEKASAADPRVKEVLERGNAFIAQIRRCNDAIPGEEISAKIDRMELIVRRIFQRAEAHPEIVPDLKKLMDYYLPMTVKLLDAYADMDAQPIQGETIQSSKREIEDSLDTLNQAFEKLLDSVFRDTAMDVSSDISVLNTLLAQEGLTEDELTKIRKPQT